MSNDPQGTRPDTAHPDNGVVVEEARPQVKQPPLYQVVLLNDDYTPMEFVVDVLEKFFALNRPTATRIMLEVRETNLAAQIFFRSAGFQAVSVLRSFYEDTPEDAYPMQYNFHSVAAENNRSARRAG